MATYSEGRYRVRIIGSDYLEPEGKSEYIELKFVVLAEVTHQGEILEQDQYDRSAKFYLTDKALPYTLEKFAGLGLKSWALLDTLIDREVFMVCKHEAGKDNGKLYEKWDLARSGGGESVAPAPIAASKASALQKKYGGSLLAAYGKSAEKPVAVANDIGVSDEDLPF
jgi:hypothetical protein